MGQKYDSSINVMWRSEAAMKDTEGEKNMI